MSLTFMEKVLQVMEKYSPTSEEREWCRHTVLRITDQLPKQYSAVTQARLKKQGIEVSRRYICDCKNLLRHDIRVVKVFEDLARDLGSRHKIYGREEIRKRFSKKSPKNNSY